MLSKNLLEIRYPYCIIYLEVVKTKEHFDYKFI